MSQLTDEVVKELQKNGYVGEIVSCNPSFDTAIASLDKELLNALNVQPARQLYQSTYILSLELRHHPTNLHLSLEFCYHLPENVEKLQCHRLSAMAGEASRFYKINYDHPMPSLHEIIQTLQQKLKMSPFIRQLDYMLDRMKDHYYNKIKSAESNVSIVDAIRRKVQSYNDNNDSGRTRLLKVSGKYDLLRNRMNTDIILELNKEKRICRIKQIENTLDNTKLIILPGRKQHLDTPFEMLTLLSDKHEIATRQNITQPFHHSSSPIHDRLAKRR
jgi:hypothetical protein